MKGINRIKVKKKKKERWREFGETTRYTYTNCLPWVSKCVRAYIYECEKKKKKKK